MSVWSGWLRVLFKSSLFVLQLLRSYGLKTFFLRNKTHIKWNISVKTSDIKRWNIATVWDRGWREGHALGLPFVLLWWFLKCLWRTELLADSLAWSPSSEAHPSLIPCDSVFEQGQRLPGASCILMRSYSAHAAPGTECPPPHKIFPIFHGPAQMSPLLWCLPRHSRQDSSPLLLWNLFILVIQWLFWACFFWCI